MKILKSLDRVMKKALHGDRKRYQYYADGLGVRGRSLTFMTEPRFAQAWQDVSAANDPHWPDHTPDIRWRAHVAVWAAEQGLRLDGDFAEFGVFTGLLAQMILRNTDFARSGKRMYLFDTFSGIPQSSQTADEASKAERFNAHLYNRDYYDVAAAFFASYPCVKLVRGELPGSLDGVPFTKLAYVSVDLNVAKPEIEVIEAIWDRLSTGAFVVLDDYGFKGHEVQHDAWNRFAARVGRRILTSPTGQGLLQR